MHRWAVFDVDGTLLPHYSMERMFIAHGIRSGLIPIKNLILAAGRAAASFPDANPAAALKGNKSYLKGLPAEAIKSAARDFCQEMILPRLARTGDQHISACRKNGFKIMILTGSPDFLAYQLQPVFHPDSLLCSTLEISRGRFTGKIAGTHPYGFAKREMLLELHRELKINFRLSAVFANHHTDVAHMELFDRATAVNPTRKLRRIASQRGWPVEMWE